VTSKSIVESVSITLDPRLRELEARARVVVDAVVRPREHEESDEAGLAMTRALGEAGLLDACVDLDVPAICVLRELVAHASGLADSMIALQGLGYGPIALAGSDAQKGALAGARALRAGDRGHRDHRARGGQRRRVDGDHREAAR
jgi:hypothetical protein